MVCEERPDVIDDDDNEDGGDNPVQPGVVQGDDDDDDDSEGALISHVTNNLAGLMSLHYPGVHPLMLTPEQLRPFLRICQLLHMIETRQIFPAGPLMARGGPGPSAGDRVRITNLIRCPRGGIPTDLNREGTVYRVVRSRRGTRFYLITDAGDRTWRIARYLERA